MLCIRNWLVKLQQIEFNNCTTIQGVGSTIGVRVCVFVCVCVCVFCFFNNYIYCCWNNC